MKRLIITEATAVESRGRISSHDLGIWNDGQIEGLKRLVDAVHLAGSKIGIQLAHAGRKGQARDETIIAPSALPFSEKYKMPEEMSIKEIRDVVMAFKIGASRAKQAGYDVIELHGAHGYLINQFLSPLSNRRDDQYGGSAMNRRRFLNEIIDAVREIWEGPLIVRISAEEYAEQGNHIEDSLSLVDTLKGKVDAINVSSGGVVPIKFDAYPGYQMELARKIKDRGIIVIGGGLITLPTDVEKFLTNGSADFIYLGRVLLNDPYFVLRTAAKAERKDLIITPYERGF